MEGVFTCDQKDFGQISHVSVVLRTFEASGNRWPHIGIFYKSPVDNNLYKLHLAMHCDLQRDLVSPTEDRVYLWTEMALPEQRQRLLKTVCQDVWDSFQEDGIPYGFSLPHSFFTRDKKSLLIGPNKTGLTCATFVLAVLELAGLCPVDYKSWKKRDGDDAWQTSILRILQSRGATAEHLRAVSAEAKGIRYRTGEVMYSSRHPLVKHRMSKVEKPGRRIEKHSEEWHSSQSQDSLSHSSEV